MKNWIEINKALPEEQNLQTSFCKKYNCIAKKIRKIVQRLYSIGIGDL